MSETFLGQIMLFAGDFAPQKFMLAAGQIIPISQNTSLFALLGTNYGGNGTQNFALPNLTSCAAVGATLGGDNSNPRTPYAIGETVGEPAVTLARDQGAIHQHPFVAVTSQGTTQTAGGNVFATAAGGTKGSQALSNIYSTNPASAKSLQPTELSPAGTAAPSPHSNLQPFLAISMCICINGIFPPRG